MSFISSYLEHTANTESPLQYHQWSCLSTLSVLAGRRFWFQLGPITYYPNLYIILVGHPGVKKSSALERAKDIIRAVRCCPVAAAQATKQFIAQKMSNEKFPGKRFFKKSDGTLEEYNQYAIFATEFTQFIGVEPLTMLDFLTTIYTEKVYDCDTKNQGSDYITGPYITMLACLTPELMQGYMKQNILTGGFARRTIFVYGTGGQIIPFPEYTETQRAAQKRCIDFGKALESQSGEFFLTPEGRTWYEAWYYKNKANLTETTPATRGYFETKHELLFKVGMLTALSEDPQGRVISDKHFEFIEQRFFLPTEKLLPRVFEGAGINPNAQAAAQICRMLEALDRPMSKKQVEAMFFDSVTSLNELRDTIDHLCNVGRLAKKDCVVNGQNVGTVIGTPAALLRATASEIYSILTRAVQQPPATDAGQS